MSANGPRTLHFAVRGPISPGDLPGLCARVCALLGRERLELAVCDVRSVEPNAGTVDALTRLQLAAKRRGCRIHLRNASDDLVELVAFMGLEDVLPER
jgi:hypothetical protein